MAERCCFEMVAVGPVFPEQADMERHTPVRDRVSALERALADHLPAAGHDVLGDHPRKAACDTAMSERLFALVDERLAATAAH